MKILQTLAPLVLGALGQQKKENNLDAEGIGNLTSNLAANFTGEGSIMSMVTNMLDANKDGNVMDDVMGLVGKFFGGKK